MSLRLEARGIAKTFVLHNQGGAVLPVLDDIDLDLHDGEMVILNGVSGAGKSTFLRILYGNYKPVSGSVRIRHNGAMTELIGAPSSWILEIRKTTLSFVSQFLRVIPRVNTIDIVKDPMLKRGVDDTAATKRAQDILTRLNLPERMWNLSPSTFSGGEQQRVNIARAFANPSPIMLLDEPTASLDADNRHVVIELIDESRKSGVAMIGIFHDENISRTVATRTVNIASLKATAA